MMYIKALRLLQLLIYVVISAQLIFHLEIFIDAYRKLSIDQFLNLRKVIDPFFMARHQAFYYAGLLLCLTMAVLSARQPGSWFFICSVIALLCLLADVIIAMKGNGPINAMTNAYIPGDHTTDWNVIREKWLQFIQYRAVLSITGLVSLLSALVFGKS